MDCTQDGHERDKPRDHEVTLGAEVAEFLVMGRSAPAEVAGTTGGRLP